MKLAILITKGVFGLACLGAGLALVVQRREGEAALLIAFGVLLLATYVEDFK